MAEKEKDRKVCLDISSRETIPSFSCRLKVPNFFTLTEYDGAVFKSPTFQFSNAYWFFEFLSDDRWQRKEEAAENDNECRRFYVNLVRLNSVIQQEIYSLVTYLDANDKEYDWVFFSNLFEEDENEFHIATFDTNERFETLCIHLFCEKSVVPDNDEIQNTTNGDLETETRIEEKNCNVTLDLSTRKSFSSVAFTLKIPNFFTMTEYDGTTFETRTLAFANAAWCFRFFSNMTWKSEDNIRDKYIDFDVSMVRLASEIPEQRIFYTIAILDNNDQEYDKDTDCTIFKEDINDVFFSIFSNRESCFDRRNSLTLIICLFYDKSTEKENTTLRDVATSTVDDFDRNEKDEKNSESDPTDVSTSTVDDFNSNEKGEKNNESDPTDSLINSPEMSDSATAINHFLNERKGIDVTFVLETSNGKVEIAAHQLILATRSSFFADEFYGEQRTKGAKIISLKDVNPKAFKDMIRYCYGWEPVMGVRRIKETCALLQVASEFKVISLVNLCRSFLRYTIIEPENVFSVLAVSKEMDDKSLTDMCQKLLEEKTEEVMQSYELLDVTPCMVHIILDLQKCSLRSEYELMKWIFEWAKVNSEQKNSNYKNAREYLEKLLGKMNFLALKFEEFAVLCEENTDFFSSDEVASIYSNIARPGMIKMPDWYGKDLRIRVYTGSKD